MRYNAKTKKRLHDWWIIAGIAVLSLALGMVGFCQYTSNGYGVPLGLPDMLYRSLQLFRLLENLRRQVKPT